MLSEMLNPDLFHGHIPWNKYEGWYFKISDKSENSFAIIPGIFLDKGNPHAFIQILISKNNFYQYFRMPFESFKSNKAPFLIKIIDNSFSFQGISARLKSDFILCKAPKEGRMIDLVRETLTAKVFIKLIDKASDKVILEDTGYNSGIEYGGDQMKILD